jgi:hypothetical protein
VLKFQRMALYEKMKAGSQKYNQGQRHMRIWAKDQGSAAYARSLATRE